MPPEFNPGTVTLAELQRWLNEAPFVPFAIVMSSSRSYPVPTPDHLSIFRLSRRVFVEFDDLSSVSINLLHVSAIEPMAPVAKS